MELGVNHIDRAAFSFSATRSANELINTTLAENLRQLGRDHLDVVNGRRRQRDSIAELRVAVLIRHLGTSGVEPRHLAEALEIAPVVCVQNRYALDRPDPVDDETLRLTVDELARRDALYTVTG